MHDRDDVFPQLDLADDGSLYDGITKGELFAAMAMQGLLSNPTLDMSNSGGIGLGLAEVATVAWMASDALLEERDNDA